MARPTMDRAIEALDRGDTDGARALCEEMKDEWRYLHDLMAGGLLGLISFVQERLGDEGVAEAWRYGNERGWRGDVEKIEGSDRRQIVYALAASLLVGGAAIGLYSFNRMAFGMNKPSPSVVEIRPTPPPVEVKSPAAPSMRESMTDAGNALATLTTRTADETVGQTRLLMPMVAGTAKSSTAEAPIGAMR